MDKLIRENLIKKMTEESFDVIIIGGGATGLGAAVDSQSRGYKTLLIDQGDFCVGTSSRSTKLIHGGLRYLQQGNIFLVLEALKERGLLCKNAPHMISHLPFCVPNYKWWEGPFYGVGLKIYDLMAGKLGLESSHHLSKEETLENIPMLEPQDLKGGVIYYDGQFDDARLAITLMMTFVDLGGVPINYMKCTGFEKEEGIITKVNLEDSFSGQTHVISGKVVINATGPFSDELRQVDDPSAEKLVVPSQGVHIVLDGSFLQSKTAILVPHTSDGRVLFFVPWHDKVLVGTTDTALEGTTYRPKAQQEEIAFLLENAKQYLVKDPTKEDILSQFAGIRPLVKEPGKASTAAISRDHTIMVSHSGLITIAGGKWTTFRKMSQDVIDKAVLIGNLDSKPCVTETLKLHGYLENVDPMLIDSSYGSDIDQIKQDPGYQKPLHPKLPYNWAHISFAIDYELAQTVEDVLSRRTRSLLLDAKASIEVAPQIAEALADRLGKDENWIAEQLSSFNELAQDYLPAS